MNLEILTEDLIKEFAIDEKTGVGSVSRRGLARLCGVSETAIRKLLKTLEDSANPVDTKAPKSLARQSVEGANLSASPDQRQDGGAFIPRIDVFLAECGFNTLDKIINQDGRIIDVPAALIVKYYAGKGNKEAWRTDVVTTGIGFRTYIQKALNWSQRPVTAKEIVELLVLPVPAPYSPKFEVEFYHQLSRLTGLTPRGHLRPQYWASLTKELVYEQMPEGVYQEIKQWQLATDPNKKLHQFLTEDGIDVLKRHLDELLLLMKSSVSIWELRESLTRVKKSLFQLSLPIGKN